MSIDNYLDWLSATIRHGVSGDGDVTMFECLLDEYLRITYRRDGG